MSSPMKDYMKQFANANSDKLPPKVPQKGGFSAYEHPNLASSAATVGGRRRRSRRNRSRKSRGGCHQSNLALTAAPVGGRRQSRRRSSKRRSRRGGGEIVPYVGVSSASNSASWNSGMVN